MSGLGSMRTDDGTERTAAELFGSAEPKRADGRASGLGSALGSRRRKTTQTNAEAPAPEQSMPAAPGAVAVWTGNKASAYADGRVLSAADVVGTPQEQLAFVTAHLLEINRLGAAAEDYVVLTKGVLLEVARDRELHKEAGADNFAQWAAEVLDIAEKYVFELLKDVQRIRAVAQLRPELRAQLTQASGRKVIAEVIAKTDVEHAELIIEESQKQAAAQGKQRATAAMLRETASTLLDRKSIPAQAAGGSGDAEQPSPPQESVPPQLLPLSKAVGEMRERVFKPLAPAAVKAAAEVDPDALGGYLDALEAEVGRVRNRIVAARKLLPVDAEVVE